MDAGAAVPPEPLPIGGLLWIPAVVLVLTMLSGFSTLSKLMGPMGSPSGVSPVAAAIHFTNLAVPLFLLLKFFERRRYVPLLIIVWCVLSAVTWIGQSLPSRAVVYKFGGAALLVSYFSLSKRVRRTFLR